MKVRFQSIASWLAEKAVQIAIFTSYMAKSLYNPFDEFTFNDQMCFLTGEILESKDENISVFPSWLMKQYALNDKPLQMLDESIATYGSLKVPCSIDAAAALQRVDRQVEQAALKGYEAVAELPQLSLFQWISNIFYGVIFNEIQAGVRQSILTGEEMNFSQALVHKFRNLHAMLQSATRPLEFEHRNPFQILVLPVNNDDDAFYYRDEINSLVFSLRMRDFGIIACLQDNGTNSVYHEEVLAKIQGKELHPIQFEEVCARFYYSAYLFNRLPEYTFLSLADQIFVEPMPLNDFTSKPIFDNWQVKTYGQVLENFWKPWGYTLFEIIKDPENAMTFLFDENGEFLERARLGLPVS